MVTRLILGAELCHLGRQRLTSRTPGFQRGDDCRADRAGAAAFEEALFDTFVDGRVRVIEVVHSRYDLVRLPAYACSRHSRERFDVRSIICARRAIECMLIPS
jgi:hypothetical protein